MAEGPVHLVVGVLPDGAGVHEQDVGALRVGGPDESVSLEEPSDALRIVFVHLAAERAHVVGAAHPGGEALLALPYGRHAEHDRVGHAYLA